MSAKPSSRKGRKRLRRSESFLGIHFDFHAGFDCTEVGRDVTPKMVADICKKVKPDYIQCDCKGHPGICSYPTKVGTPDDGVDKRHATSVFGPYVDELLIPQFKELVDVYDDVDGVWVDGECWGSEMDYC
jgi:hypothetical protein